MARGLIPFWPYDLHSCFLRATTSSEPCMLCTDWWWCCGAGAAAILHRTVPANYCRCSVFYTVRNYDIYTGEMLLPIDTVPYTAKSNNKATISTSPGRRSGFVLRVQYEQHSNCSFVCMICRIYRCRDLRTDYRSPIFAPLLVVTGLSGFRAKKCSHTWANH